MAVFKCSCGAVSIEVADSAPGQAGAAWRGPPADCVGCMACGTSLASSMEQRDPEPGEDPLPPVRVWRALVPHMPRPISEDEGAPRRCTNCGQAVD